MGKLTKAAMVEALDDGFRSTREISEIVGVRPEYVRACRQRRNGSKADKNYNRKVRATGDRVAARKAYRQAYKKLRDNGASPDMAKSRAFNAYRRTMVRTYGGLSHAS